MELTSAARMPENDPAFESAEVLDGRLVLHYSATPEQPLEVGQVLGGAGYLRRVLSVADLGGGRFELATELAGLTDFIARAHYRFGGNTRALRREALRAGPGDVAGRSEALGGGFELLAGTSLVRCGAEAGIEIEPYADLDFDFEGELDIGVSLGWTGPRVRLNKLLLAVNYSLEFGSRMDIERPEFHCIIDVPGIPEIPLGGFLLGPVPFEIKLSPWIWLTGSGRADTDRARRFDIEVVHENRVGFEGSSDGFEPIWEPHNSATFFREFTDVGDASVAAGVQVGMDFGVYAFGAAGPFIWVNADATAHFETEAPEYCEWHGDLTAGLNAGAGVVLQVPLPGPLPDLTLAEARIGFSVGPRATLWEDSGTFSWCVDEMPPTCMEAEVCVDAFGTVHCPADTGYIECGPGEIRACTCDAGTWTACGTCVAI